mgnify:CR=1 FL=1
MQNSLKFFRDPVQEETLLTIKGRNTARRASALSVILAAIAALWLWHSRAPSETPSATRTAPASGGRHAQLAPVQAATATSESVPRYLSGLGTITAANTVTVRSRVDGQLLAIHFKEGQQVKAGDLLAEIDPSAFNVALAQA